MLLNLIYIETKVLKNNYVFGCYGNGLYVSNKQENSVKSTQ